MSDPARNRPSLDDRLSIARRRIRSILNTNTVVLLRTLEQKISDAGPNHLRVDPHILTRAKRSLEQEGSLVRRRHAGADWYHLSTASEGTIITRLNLLEPIHTRLNQENFKKRLGQTLEIAIYRTFGTSPSEINFIGGFFDLNDHDDSRLYSKDEPPSAINHLLIPGRQKLDFLAFHPTAGVVGIEAKNIREWIYPRRTEVMELLSKCCAINAVPVLIARRIHYSTYSVLHRCGVLVHQTYNQLFPEADATLASEAKHKDLLGYHDIRLGNQPDNRLSTFTNVNLPSLLVDARARFNDYKDLLDSYSNGQMSYAEFAARARRRERGENEDGDHPDPSDYYDYLDPTDYEDEP